MFLIIGVVLVIAYLVGMFAFHFTAAAMHAVLIGALVMLTLHFVWGRWMR